MATTRADKKNERREELSDKTLELMLFREVITNLDFVSRLSGVVDFRWFRTPHIRLMAEFAMAYFKKYGGLVTRDLMESVIQRRNETQVIEANKTDLNTALYDFNKARDLDLGAMDNAEKIAKIQAYVKREAMRNALLDSATNLESSNTDGLIEDTLHRFEDIQKMLFEEMDLGIELSKSEVDKTMESHMDFLTNPKARISTGWECLDSNTKGGFYRDGKSIYVFMGQAGLGKSNILANLGYNFLKQDLKVVVISMEMSQNVYLRRFDSLITKVDIDELGFDCFKGLVEERMEKFFQDEHPDARLNVKEFPPNSKSPKDIQSYLEKMEEGRGWKPDVLIVDYLNILKPNGGSTKGDAAMYQDGKVLSEQLRELSYSLSIPVITAVQCNSSGFNTADIGMQNIAESRGIAHTADFIAGLYQTEDEGMDGVFHMKILKSRLGPHANLKFEFDKHTMEFKDVNDVGDHGDNGGTGTSTIDSSKSNMKLPLVTEDDFDPIRKDMGMP